MCMCVSQIGQWFKCLQYFITWRLKRDTCRDSSPLMSGARSFLPNPYALPCLCSRVLVRCPSHLWSLGVSETVCISQSYSASQEKTLLFSPKVEMPLNNHDVHFTSYSVAASDDQSIGLLLIWSFNSGFRWFPWRQQGLPFWPQTRGQQVGSCWKKSLTVWL